MLDRAFLDRVLAASFGLLAALIGFAAIHDYMRETPFVGHWLKLLLGLLAGFGAFSMVAAAANRALTK